MRPPVGNSGPGGSGAAVRTLGQAVRRWDFTSSHCSPAWPWPVLLAHVHGLHDLKSPQIPPGQQAPLYFSPWNVFSFHPVPCSFPDPLLPVWCNQHPHGWLMLLYGLTLLYLLEAPVVFALVTALFFTHLLPHIHTHTLPLSPGFIFEVATLLFFFFLIDPKLLSNYSFHCLWWQQNWARRKRQPPGPPDGRLSKNVVAGQGQSGTL